MDVDLTGPNDLGPRYPRYSLCCGTGKIGKKTTGCKTGNSYEPLPIKETVSELPVSKSSKVMDV